MKQIIKIILIGFGVPIISALGWKYIPKIIIWLKKKQHRGGEENA